MSVVLLFFYKCNRSSNTLSEISARICVPNKTKDVNLSFFKFDNKKDETKNIKKTDIM